MNALALSTVYTRLMEGWFILPTAYDAMWAASMRLDGALMGMPGDDDDGCRPRYTVGNDGVAVLPVYGPTARKPEWWEKKYLGVVAQEDIARELDRAEADPMVRALVLDFDSPGGHAVGTPEQAQRVAALNARKPVVAFTSGYMASAAYYVGSHATTVIATGSAHVGSIGTVLSFLDISGWYEQLGVKREVIVNEGATFKGMAIPGTSLTKEQRTFLQEQITRSGDLFKAAVKSKRRVDDDSMRGQTLFGDQAVSAGLVDQLGDLAMARRTAVYLAAGRNAGAS